MLIISSLHINAAVRTFHIKLITVYFYGYIYYLLCAATHW